MVAAIKYLLTRKAEPKTVSMASGKGINVRSIEQDVKDCLQSESRELLNFRRSGPDIIAVSKKECWIVECKGAGKGKAQTQRNNFDRALASVVSYYGNRSLLPNAAKHTKPVFSLALPASTHYRRLLEQRVHAALRRRLNLWVLLYERSMGKITPVAPNRAYPR